MAEITKAWLEYRYDEDGEYKVHGVCTYSTMKNVYDDLNEFASVCETLVDIDDEVEIPNEIVPNGLIQFVKTPKPSMYGIPIEWKRLYTEQGLKKMEDYPYQRETISTIIHKQDGTAMVVMDMGMGKTMIAGCCAKYYLTYIPGCRVLVIAPGSTHKGWKKDSMEYCNVQVHEIKGIKNEMVWTPGKFSLVTYETARDNHAVLMGKWDVVILDESQEIKNVDARKTQRIVELTRKARVRLLLSGTPREKCNSELYTQISCIIPNHKEVLGSYTDYIKRYCSAELVFNPFCPSQKKWELGRSRYEEELNVLLTNGVMVRVARSAEDIAKLPTKKFRIDEYVDIKDPVILQGLQSLAKEQERAQTTNQKNAITQKIWRLTGLGKFDGISEWCLKWLKEHVGEKLVLFAHNTDLMKKYQAFFEHEGYRTAYIDGETPLKKRAEIIESLSKTDDHTYQVAILSYGTCACGITLCPGCWTCVLVELEFILSVLLQAEDKLFRLGMIRDVYSYWFRAKGTIDDGVLGSGMIKLNGNSVVTNGVGSKLVFSIKDEELTIWKQHGLSELEARMIAISKLPGGDEEDEEYVRRCTIRLEEVVEGVRVIECPMVNRMLGVKRVLRSDNKQLVAILVPSTKKETTKRHKLES